MTVMSVVRRLKKAAQLGRKEEGQAMVEYALLVSLVALAAFVAVQIFGHGVAGLYSHIYDKYPHG